GGRADSCAPGAWLGMGLVARLDCALVSGLVTRANLARTRRRPPSDTRHREAPTRKGPRSLVFPRARRARVSPRRRSTHDSASTRAILVRLDPARRRTRRQARRDRQAWRAPRLGP